MSLAHVIECEQKSIRAATKALRGLVHRQTLDIAPPVVVGAGGRCWGFAVRVLFQGCAKLTPCHGICALVTVHIRKCNSSIEVLKQSCRC